MQPFKTILAAVLVLLLVLSAVSCAPSETGKPTEPEKQTDPVDSTEPEPEPSDTTPDESEEPAKKPVLLVVSFGTSYNDNREATIGALEKALTDAYPDYEVRRAFTSQIIIDKLKDRDKLEIDNVTEAMNRLVADGVKDVIIQPTHVMSGFEYDDVVKETSAFKDKFTTFKIGKPLLTSDADFEKVAAILAEQTDSENKKETAFVFMGHGTEHAANATYARMQKVMTDAGHKNFFVGTVEAAPTVEDVLKMVKDAGFKKVQMRPLMIVAGDHANNDMAGDEDDSWKSIFEKAGMEVECVLEGLGQYKGIQEIFKDHVADTIAGK
ncbi:MAG TPA: sirohydrochlorin cobaltochelatase [Bacillota bacterium]|mgnify:CR=1 FL=1|nr:sirohydrochlorin cobaltochelatase [Bacillota bacterium]